MDGGREADNVKRASTWPEDPVRIKVIDDKCCLMFSARGL